MSSLLNEAIPLFGARERWAGKISRPINYYRSKRTRSHMGCVSIGDSPRCARDGKLRDLTLLARLVIDQN